ncbi:MAG: transcriptional repressor [Geopsychrobacter sp.]|nr:transcriptional repressor [Geopsychrobacter sp.]
MQDPFECTPTDHQHCISSALARAESLCRQQQVRLTPMRRRVLELVWQHHRPVGAYALLEQLQQQGRAAPPTVYRALDFLQSQGLIHRLESLNAFIGCAQPHRPHQGQFLICQSCQSLAEITDDGIERAIDAGARTAGFTPSNQMVEIMGTCASCRQQGATDV